MVLARADTSRCPGNWSWVIEENKMCVNIFHSSTMKTATFRIWRGDVQGGNSRITRPSFRRHGGADAIHQIQAKQANDLACRWNCKAGKCGSCSAEVNGLPRLMCMTRLSDLP